MALRRWTVAAVALGASVAVVMPAGARPGDPGAPAQDENKHEARHDHDRDHDKGDRDHDDMDRDARHHGPHGKSDDDRDADKDKDKDKDRDTDRKEDRSAADAKEFRRGLFERRERAIVESLNRDRKALTDEARDAIGRHWRHLTRLLRIRELAAAAKEDDVVHRVEQDIAREEKAFTARLERVRGQAPEAGGAR
jgi:hypothetical protein